MRSQTVRALSGYSAFRDAPGGKKFSIFSPRPVAGGVVGSGGMIVESSGGVTLTLGATIISAACSNCTPWNLHLTSRVGIDFSKKIRLLILAQSAYQGNADCTARFQFRADDGTGVAAIDGTNWGLEAVANNGYWTLRAAKSGTAGGSEIVSAGTVPYVAAKPCIELVHDPAVGFKLYNGTGPADLALIDSIATGAEYPAAADTSGHIAITWDRVDVVHDTTQRYFYCSGLNPMQLG